MNPRQGKSCWQVGYFVLLPRLLENGNRRINCGPAISPRKIPAQAKLGRGTLGCTYSHLLRPIDFDEDGSDVIVL